MYKMVNGETIPMTAEDIAVWESMQPTTEQKEIKRLQNIKNNIDNAITNILDTQAQSLNYDNINSIAKYIGYDNPFRIESESLGAWCANVWVKVNQIQTDFNNGLIPEPTIESVILALPKYTG